MPTDSTALLCAQSPCYETGTGRLDLPRCQACNENGEFPGEEENPHLYGHFSSQNDEVSGSKAPARSKSNKGIPVVSEQVPGFYIFGDSTVDSGNNNYLGTFARANMPPYGRDFDTHMPTGRFSNGRLTIDYLALFMGLPFVPTYLGVGGIVENMVAGVNFASAGAGVLHFSGDDLGQHISLSQQTEQFSEMSQDMSLAFGADETKERISKSIIYVSVGSNDYIHYYLRNVSGIQSLQPPWKFNKLLVQGIRDELMHLYNANVRKMVVVGIGPLGCAPHFLWETNSQSGECAENINNMIIEFNFALKYMVDSLNSILPGATIVYCDIFEGLMDILHNPQVYGFAYPNDACCGLGKFGGGLICAFPSMACSDASTHVWWDQFHTSDAVNSIMADNQWNARFTKVCYPMDLRDLVSVDS
ncbi:hypothetical protein KI387_014208 [Taxus chinensis]|uniref:GDSL esterase/lipase n=1 Tax=Taxus chinensis TaxID=29808 RepID=A0AA38CKX6_TAXCH|nr:hypothetical protein KI387_014208 [Taxus chinensis]